MDISLDTILNPYLIPWGSKIMLATTIIIIGQWIARLLAKTMQKVMSSGNVDFLLVNCPRNIAYTFLVVVAVLAVLEQLSVTTTSALAILGAAGLAIGLVLKDPLSSHSNGVTLSLFRPFKLGGIEVRSWVSVADLRITRADLHETIKATFDKDRIDNPYPHCAGHLKQITAA